MNIQSITDYIIQNQDCLRIAAAVHDAWPHAREHITNLFVGRLRARLLSELPNWVCELDDRPYEDRWSGLYWHKDTWREQYYIILQFREYGQNMLLGILAADDTETNESSRMEILESVRSCQSSVRQNTNWEAHVTMTCPATDWTSPDILWRMHSDSSFLESVAEQILVMARATEPIIDRLTLM